MFYLGGNDFQGMIIIYLEPVWLLFWGLNSLKEGPNSTRKQRRSFWVPRTRFFWLVYGGFLKWWYPTTIGFPTKNDCFGVFWGYHHLRKHLFTPCKSKTIKKRCQAVKFQGCNMIQMGGSTTTPKGSMHGIFTLMVLGLPQGGWKPPGGGLGPWEDQQPWCWGVCKTVYSKRGEPKRWVQHKNKHFLSTEHQKLKKCTFYQFVKLKLMLLRQGLHLLPQLLLPFNVLKQRQQQNP